MDNQVYKTTVVSTRIRLARNINNLPFPNRLNGEEEIYSVLYSGVDKSCKELFPFKMIKMESANAVLKGSLVERHLISKNLINSEYGAVFISDAEDVSIMVNEEDHLRIQSIINGYDLESAYNKVAKVDSELKKNLDIAFDKNLGYLTACPTNLGAAMRASVMLFLPGLAMSGKIETIINQYQEHGITIRGMYGEGSKAEGFLFQVSNQAAISLSEKQILQKVKQVVDSIVEKEDRERQIINQARGIDLQNDIMISYGILKYAVKMSSKELMQNIAMVKLGVCLGYLKIDINKLNSLMVMTQPSMLCFMSKTSLSAQQRDIERATLTKKYLN